MSITPLVLAAGAEFVLGPSTLAVQHAGDVVLEQTLGRRLVRLEAGGDVTLRAPRTTGVVLAQGALTVEADTDADELRADTIHIGAVEVNTRVIVARTRVVIAAGARLSVDILVAPEVVIDPSASGRVKLMDCMNDRQPTKVRGCLSLEEYEADNGGVAEFLSQRGVTPLNPLPDHAEETGRHAALAAAPPPAVPEPVVAKPPPEPARLFVPLTPEPAAAARPAPVVAEPPPPPPSVKRAVSPTLVAVAVPDEEPAPPRPAAHNRQQTQLRRAWTRIEDAYGANPPAAVRRLGELVAQAPAELPDQLDGLWRDTLREHIARGTTPPRPVILAFHALRALAA